MVGLFGSRWGHVVDVSTPLDSLPLVREIFDPESDMDV